MGAHFAPTWALSAVYRADNPGVENNANRILAPQAPNAHPPVTGPEWAAAATRSAALQKALRGTLLRNNANIDGRHRAPLFVVRRPFIRPAAKETRGGR